MGPNDDTAVAAHVGDGKEGPDRCVPYVGQLVRRGHGFASALQSCVHFGGADKRYKPNLDGYLFVNSKGRPFPSDNVVKYGIHRAMEKLGIQTPKGVHIGIHCFRHGVTTELLESGTPIHVVTRMMRHGDSKVTLDHYAHVIGETERSASEK